MKIITWNVNSVKARLQHVLRYCKEEAPDVLLLQELKCETAAFPFEEIEALGYNCAVHGQKTYNGVAILSKFPLDDVTTGLPDQPLPEQARYIEALVQNDAQVVRVASVYVPNGQAPDSDKFAFKMDFFAALHAHLQHYVLDDTATVIGGDYNVGIAPIDVYAPEKLAGSICFHPQERAQFRRLLHMGWVDSWRAHHPNDQAFSWWDYRAGAWQQNKGLRIDYLLTNPLATDQIQSVQINDTPRDWEKASDHTPVELVLG